jgi:hypothetical protein
MDVWRSALAMIQADPLTGVGPGLFGQAYRLYRTMPDDYMLGAHNLYLNIIAETGLLGGAASGATLLVFLRSISKRRMLKQDAVLAALIGIGAHMLVDNFPATNFVFLVGMYAAYLLDGEKRRTPFDVIRERMKRRLPDLEENLSAITFVWVFSLLVLFGTALLYFDACQFYYQESLKAGSLAEARAAAMLDPGNRLYQIQVARLEGSSTDEIDATLVPATSLWHYGIANFGRVIY